MTNNKGEAQKLWYNFKGENISSLVRSYAAKKRLCKLNRNCHTWQESWSMYIILVDGWEDILK